MSDTVDQIFDRLGNLLRSLFQDEDAPVSEGTRRASSMDPDLDEAWEELDEFLKTGKDSGASKGANQQYQQYRKSTGSASRAGIPDELKRDYANLEVAPNADTATVRKAYHKLIRQYHPDRFAHDPEKQKQATEITQKINQSYQRITKFRETGKL